jgi:hypothetical protein
MEKKMSNLFKKFKERALSGSSDKKTSTLWTTPWSWRTNDGIYVGWNKDAWLYREIEIAPLQWEDPGKRLAFGGQLGTLLTEIGSLSRDVGGVKVLSSNREIHLISIGWESPIRINNKTPEPLKEYLEETLTFTAPSKTLMLGVKLRSSIATSAVKKGSVLEAAKAVITSGLGEDVPDLSIYEADIENLNSVFTRNGGRVPSKEALLQLESWYNLGRGPDVLIKETKDLLFIDDYDAIEVAAVMRFEQPIMQAPNSQWIMDAATNPTGPAVVSVRGQLEPPGVARARLRRSQRKTLATQQEESATGDLERRENVTKFELAQIAEDFFTEGREPLISECSILMARRSNDPEAEFETYIDELRNTYGIEMKPLEHRQLAALDETLPCSNKRLNPFLHDVTVSTLAYSGIQGYSNLGDDKGIYIGLSDPFYTPVWIDPLRAPSLNLPPAMAVFGDPGSGKTFLCQSIATQATLAGIPTIFINPKGFDTLSPTAELVGGDVVKMTRLESAGGYFDPFRFTDPELAASILASHILSVFSGGLDNKQEIKVQVGLKRGAVAGARCAQDAIEYIDEPEIRTLILEQAESDATFALAIGKVEQAPLGGKAGLTLIEFDRKLNLPEKGTSPGEYTREQRINLAAIRLVARASLEMLNRAGGGVFILDEAWTFLSSSDSLALLQQLGREGRSLNILPIFATQRVADLMRQDVEIESYLSRVFVMKLQDDVEATAALKLCGLEPTASRVQWLKTSGPRREEGGRPARPALAIHRDVLNRHSALMVGPVPENAKVAFTTNPTERKERDEN